MWPASAYSVEAPRRCLTLPQPFFHRSREPGCWTLLRLPAFTWACYRSWLRCRWRWIRHRLRRAISRVWDAEKGEPRVRLQTLLQARVIAAPAICDGAPCIVVGRLGRSCLGLTQQSNGDEQRRKHRQAHGFAPLHLGLSPLIDLNYIKFYRRGHVKNAKGRASGSLPRGQRAIRN